MIDSAAIVGMKMEDRVHEKKEAVENGCPALLPFVLFYGL